MHKRGRASAKRDLVCIHTPCADDGSTVARSAAHLQNVKGDGMSGSCQLWLKLHEGRGRCRREVVGSIGKGATPRHEHRRSAARQQQTNGGIHALLLDALSPSEWLASPGALRCRSGTPSPSHRLSLSCRRLMPNCPSLLLPKLKSCPRRVTANA